MIIWLTRKLFSSRKGKPQRDETAGAAPPPKADRPVRPDWERVLTASLEQNSVAPSEDVILHSYDLYCQALYEPLQERRHRIAQLYAEIAADIAALQALAPDLIQRAVTRHPFEFANILENKETR